MKNLMYKLFIEKNTKLTLLLTLGIFAVVGLGCFGSGKNKAKPLPSEYQGSWTGSDGSTLNIRADNSGDFRSGNYKVDNATVELDDTGKTLKFTFFGVAAKELSVDSAPNGNSMKLAGVNYKKSGGDSSDTKNLTTDSSPAPRSTTSTSAKHADASKGQIPEREEMDEMTKTALMDFNDAVQQGDFTDFHGKISKIWQKQTSPEKFNESFGEFIRQKIDISDIQDLDPDYAPSPSIDSTGSIKRLVASGRYATSPVPTKFNLKWIPEGREWKLFGIEVDTTKY